MVDGWEAGAATDRAAAVAVAAPALAAEDGRARGEFLAYRVTALRYEAESVLSVELAPVRETVPTWGPGAHLELRLGNGLIRQYSLCGQAQGPLQVAVRLTEATRGGSGYVHSALRPGDVVEVRGPGNQFPLHQASAYRFLAAGIGITPILSMVRAAAAVGAEWTLDYLGRSRAASPFLAELEEFGERVRFHDSAAGGRFDLRTHLAPPAPGELAYACGPTELLRTLESAAVTWPDPGALHVERFTGGESPAGDAGENGAFAVELADGGEVTVGAGESILEALESAGYAPLNSCREGICGTCETRVVAGDIDHRDSLLSEAEKAANETVMICVSRARQGCARIALELQ